MLDWLCGDIKGGGGAAADAPPPPYAPPLALPLPLATVSLRVNGALRRLPSRLCGAMTLAAYLREHELLTATKLSCAEGGCGACTVLLKQPGEPTATPANACLRLLVACDGCDVTTVEGIGTASAPHAFQRALAEHDGSQCGFCSPGMVAALVSLLQAAQPPTPAMVEEAFDGNLCRCTGYRRILDAAHSLLRASAAASAEEAVALALRAEHAGDIEDLGCAAPEKAAAGCAHEPAGPADGCGARPPPVPLLARGSCASAPDYHRPASLREALTVLRALTAAGRAPELLGANTGRAGVSKYYPTAAAPPAAADSPSGAPATPPPPARPLVDVSLVAEMRELVVHAPPDPASHGVTVGASVTLEELRALALRLAAAAEGAGAGGEGGAEGADARGARGERWAAVAAHLQRVAGRPVRCVATVGGSVAFALAHVGFASDVLLLLEALEASVDVARIGGGGGGAEADAVRLPLSELRAHGAPHELLIVRFNIPPPPPPPPARASGRALQLLFTFKSALRQRNAHAILSAAVSLTVALPAGGAGLPTIVRAAVRYCGLADGTVVRAAAAEAALAGAPLGCGAALQAALGALQPVAAAVSDADARVAGHKRALVPSLLYSALLQAAAAADAAGAAGPAALVPPNLGAAAAGAYARPLSSGRSHVLGSASEAAAPVSRPEHKQSALAQCTGEAKFVDDAPRRAGQLHAAFALAPAAGGVLRALHVDAARASGDADGRGAFGVRVLTAADVEAAGLSNELAGPPLSEEEGQRPAPLPELLLLPLGARVPHAGARVALVVAETREAAEAAAALVVAVVAPEGRGAGAGEGCDKSKDEGGGVLVDVDGAVAAAAFFHAQPVRVLLAGDAAGALAAAPVVVRGSTAVGGQYHFYMETQTAAVSPDGQGGWLVEVSAQGPQLVAAAVARALRVDSSRVEAVVPRAGGAYGGKATRSVPCAVGAAVAAALLGGRPVCIALELRANMRMLGARRPYRFDYEAAADASGALLAVRGCVYMLQGAHADLGSLPSVAELSVALDGSYNIPAWDVSGFTARADVPANTWCRGPTFLPGQLLIEAVVEHVAAAARLDADAVRAASMYRSGDVAACGVRLQDCTLARCVAEAKQRAGYAALAARVAAANAGSRYVKEGLALAPFKYAMGGAAGHRALVSVGADGSVSVSQSGCESGQGLLIKQAQAAAAVFHCGLARVRVLPTSSRVSNRITGGSTTSEANVASVTRACEAIAARMVPVRAALQARLGRPPTWEEAAAASAQADVDLTAAARYAGELEPGVLPGAPTDGAPAYFAYGAALAHVRLDALLGEAVVLRAELVTDQGASLNPAIDLGQVHGAFAMGLGYVLTERMAWAEGEAGEGGALLTAGTWEYKPPGAADMPVQLNVAFLDGAPNGRGVYGSKAVGEPAILGAACVLSALRHAVRAVREDEGHREAHAPLDAPATPDAISQACALDWRRFSF